MQYVYKVPRPKDYSKDKRCAQCEEWFTPKDPKARYCNPRCSGVATAAAAHQTKLRLREEASKIP